MTPTTMKSFVADRNRATAIPESSTASLAALKVQVGSTKQKQESAPRGSSVFQQNANQQTFADQDQQPWTNPDNAINVFTYDDFNDLDTAFGDDMQPPIGDVSARPNDIEQTGGISFRHLYMEGDSYPDTTSGILSEHDDANPPAHAFEPVNRTSWYSQNSNQAGQYQARQQQAGQHQTVQQSSTSQQAHHDQSSRLTAFSRPAEPDAPAFAFGMRAAQTQRSVLVGSNTNNPTAHHDSPTDDAQPSWSERSVAQNVPNHQHLQMQQPATMSFNALQNRKPSPIPTAEPIAQPADSRLDRNIHLDDLDYERSALYAMDYDDLKDQPFDHDPGSTASAVQADVSLAQRLEAAATATDVEESDFASLFESMNSADWEVAGEWIRDELSKATADLIAIRRRKRVSAKEYEAEVDQWYTGIRTKQKAAEGALKEMRTRGQDLLGGMPSK